VQSATNLHYKQIPRAYWDQDHLYDHELDNPKRQKTS